MLKMYAIPNCDTVKKARAFLDKKKISYEFFDFKKTSPTKEMIEQWTLFLNDLPVNKKGTTYKKLKDEFVALSSEEKVNFMIKNSSMIKRPVLEKNNKIVAIGFDEETYSQLKL